jgi:hypothetical protein
VDTPSFLLRYADPEALNISLQLLSVHVAARLKSRSCFTLSSDGVVDMDDLMHMDVVPIREDLSALKAKRRCCGIKRPVPSGRNVNVLPR